jgi:hypothetical protein
MMNMETNLKELQNQLFEMNQKLSKMTIEHSRMLEDERKQTADFNEATNEDNLRNEQSSLLSDILAREKFLLRMRIKETEEKIHRLQKSSPLPLIISTIVFVILATLCS